MPSTDTLTVVVPLEGGEMLTEAQIKRLKDAVDRTVAEVCATFRAELADRAREQDERDAAARENAKLAVIQG